VQSTVKGIKTAKKKKKEKLKASADKLIGLTRQT
jgi:hypothetical protein